MDEAEAKLHEGLQSDPNPMYLGCIHRTHYLNKCWKCVAELRDRERQEMLRLSFERLADVLEKLEAKL